jgi:hypothetical protein
MIFTFDPPETWDVNAQAFVEPNATAPSQPNVLRMTFGGADPSANHAILGLVLGQRYRVFVRCNFDEMDNASVYVRFQYADNASYFEARVFKDPDASGWEIRDLGIMTYGVSNGLLRLVGFQNFNPGRIYFDSILITDPSITAVILAGKWAAIDGAITALRTITGSVDGYNTNLENRVYSRLFLPSETTGLKLPYVCFSLDQEGERIEYEGLGFSSRWSMTGFGFFEDNPESNPMDSTGMISAALFRDDLIRAFTADQSLAGAVLNCEVTSVETASGSVGDPWTWVVFTVEFWQQLGRSDLEVA